VNLPCVTSEQQHRLSCFNKSNIYKKKKDIPTMQNQEHTSSRCHCHRKGIGATFKLVLNDWQLCTCQEKKNAFLSQVFRKHVFQIACHWFFVIYHHNTLFTWLSYGDENVKQFFGFTYNAVMCVLKIIRCNTWGQDTLVSVSHYFCSVFLNWPIYSIFLIVYLKYRMTFQRLTLCQLNKGKKPIS